MKRSLFACSLLALAAAISGCAMCGSPYDDTFDAQGGLWQRTDPTSGRVGSLFEPAGTKAGEGATEYVSTTGDQPTPGEEPITDEVIIDELPGMDQPEAAPAPQPSEDADPDADAPPALPSVLVE